MIAICTTLIESLNFNLTLFTYRKIAFYFGQRLPTDNVLQNNPFAYNLPLHVLLGIKSMFEHGSVSVMITL